MRVAIDDARRLGRRALLRLGYEDSEAEIIIAHLLDCELRGLGFSGLARILSIAERLGGAGPSQAAIETLKETAVSARLAGADKIGYLVAQQATTQAIAKAEQAGIAIVGASDTWYTGMLSYYAEMAVARDLVVMIASNASPWVAPEGGAEGRFGTNPICFGFPSDGDPVIWDIGTSAIIHAEVVLAERLGADLPAGTAFDAAGRPTREPAAALGGALSAWGGHRGSGLALTVQLLGMLAGSPMMPGHLREFGFLIIAVRPDLLTDLADYKAQLARYAEEIRATRAVEGGPPVRMPFERSIAERRRRLADGAIDVPEVVLEALTRLAA